MTQRITKELSLSYSLYAMLGKEEFEKEAMKPYEGYNPEVVNMYRDEKWVVIEIEFDSLDG
jgi:hypothetical protein